jgi:two-component system cell cycle response regulator DivK
MKPTVLYIEDHPDNMTLVRRILRSDTYSLLEAKTGLQGLSMAESQVPDLILLDINLPDIDGYEITRRLRSSANFTLAQMPIIAVTANALKGDSKKAMDAGCDAYFSKPIDIHELLETVELFVCKNQ